MTEPLIELLKANHTFPGPYVFKIIGLNENNFLDRVLRAAQLELGSLQIPTHTSRVAEGGRHISVTLELIAEDAEQVLSLYKKFKELDGLVILL
jgi:putative lipoic acid-binding regulatory protein